jgi:hypothetical protein
MVGLLAGLESDLEDCYRIRIATPRQPLGIQQHGVQRHALEQRIMMGNPTLIWMRVQRERFIEVRRKIYAEATDELQWKI